MIDECDKAFAFFLDEWANVVEKKKKKKHLEQNFSVKLLLCTMMTLSGSGTTNSFKVDLLNTRWPNSGRIFTAKATVSKVHSD